MFRLIFLFAFIVTNLNASPILLPSEKILQVTVDESGTISIGRDIISSDELARYIQERLFKSWLGTGQMHDKIKFFKANEEVPDMVIQVVLKEIQEGQLKALTQVCLQKYNNRFENVDKKKQDKLRKQFPVLFQTDYLAETGT